MRKSVQTIFATVILLAAVQLLAGGGLFVMLGNPDANPEARAHNAVLTLKMAGCAQPEKATITATAIRIVEGKRQTIPLKLIALSEPGSYAVTRQWPEGERWVLQFVAGNNDRILTSTLVAAGPNGIERHNAKMAMQPPAEADVLALLSGGPEMARK
jgi:hypothetical protein